MPTIKSNIINKSYHNILEGKVTVEEIEGSDIYSEKGAKNNQILETMYMTSVQNFSQYRLFYSDKFCRGNVKERGSIIDFSATA